MATKNKITLWSIITNDPVPENEAAVFAFLYSVFIFLYKDDAIIRLYILQRRFGLDGYPANTIKELAKALGKSKTRISQMEQSTIWRLKHYYSKYKDKDFNFAFESYERKVNDLSFIIKMRSRTGIRKAKAQYFKDYNITNNKGDKHEHTRRFIRRLCQ